MRRTDAQQETLYNMVFPEQRVPTGHPLGPIREMVNAALKQLDEDLNRGDPGPRPYAGPARNRASTRHRHRSRHNPCSELLHQLDAGRIVGESKFDAKLWSSLHQKSLFA